MDNKFSWMQTIGAIFVVILSFFILIYFVAPIFDAVMTVYWKFFGDPRFPADDPGFVTLLFRGLLTSGASTYIAFKLAFKFFENFHEKTVALIFAVTVLLWASVFIYAGVKVGDAIMPVVILIVGIIPPMYFAREVWNGEQI